MRGHHDLFYFYPRSPRGERLQKIVYDVLLDAFLSTLPARGATRADAPLLPADQISIHAPREGSDAVTSCLPMLSQLFLSTLPARGATRIFKAARRSVA